MQLPRITFCRVRTATIPHKEGVTNLIRLDLVVSLLALNPQECSLETHSKYGKDALTMSGSQPPLKLHALSCGFAALMGSCKLAYFLYRLLDVCIYIYIL